MPPAPAYRPDLSMGTCRRDRAPGRSWLARGTVAAAGPMTAGPRDQLADFAERVLDVVDAIPPGQVMSYGDIAEYLG